MFYRFKPVYVFLFLVLSLALLALLINNAAGSFACGLARGLAFAAAAALCGLLKVLGIKCLNSLHVFISSYHV